MKNSVARDRTSSIKLTPLFLGVVATITVALALPLVFHWLTADSASPPGYGVALAISGFGVLAAMVSALLIKRAIEPTLFDIDRIL
jgi:hypothetical protein